ncbi:reverse transcriptase domain-containing protein [Tanacetum coccineum]
MSVHCPDGWRNGRLFLLEMHKRFTLLTKTPKEILALDKGKFKPPPPMTTPVEKRNASKFCEFHGEGSQGAKTPLLVKQGEEEITQLTHDRHFISVRSPSTDKTTESYSQGPTRSKSRIHAVRSTWSRSDENTSSSVYSSLNAKIPSNRRNSYITEQQDYSIRMHNGFRTRSVAARSTLTEEGRKELCALLRRNLDIFAWKPADITRVLRHIAEHNLNIREGCLPVRQNKKGQAPKRNKAIYEEVEKLVDAGIMKEVNYHSWLSNPVMIKNVGATYERLVDKAFQKQIGQNLKVYVDDLVIKSRTEQEVIRDIEKNFKTLKEINMKLNPKKCTFGMREGMFLGYKVNADGLKVCLDKVEAILSLPFPKCLKDVERLNGKLASLNRFQSKLAEKSLPSFKTLKKCTKKTDFQWTAEAETTFKQIKILIAELPMLTTPKEKEELVIYLAAAKEAISAVLMTKRDEKQMPIYFVSRTLQGPEINYTPMEKLILALIGSSCIDGSRAGLIITNSKGMEFTYALRFRFNATNNEAEYEALIAGLQIAEQIGVKKLQVNIDSRLVANQVNGTYIAKEPGMIKYLKMFKNLANTFKEFPIKQVPRGENKKADALSKMASTSFTHLSKQVLVEELKEKSIDEKEVLAVVEEEGCTWMTPIYEYLTKEIIKEEKRNARAIHRKAGRYAVTNGILYKRSFLGPWLRYVGPLQANYVLREIHEGSCSMHAGPRFVVVKALRSRNPQQNLTPITSPWPFYKWGIGIDGPFPKGPGKVKFLILAIDYFTKWIEAKPVATIMGAQVKKFVWDNIVCRFSLPGEIISDNGKRFRYNPFKDWCEKLCIRQCFTSVKHPQANGLVERENRSLDEGIKAWLEKRSKN